MNRHSDIGLFVLMNSKHIHSWPLSAENILFLKAVADFKALFRRKASEDDIFASATAIFNQYIDAQSPMEVNLPARISKIYRKPEGFDESRRSEVLNENYFDEASASITKLLHDDSLPRFKRAHRDVWDSFVASQNEVKLMSNIKVVGSSMSNNEGSMGHSQASWFISDD